MIEKFKPTWQVKRIYSLTPEELRKAGIKAVLTDLDNTLIAWDNPEGTSELKRWIAEMRTAKIPVVVVSNNSRPRVKRALSHIELPFVSRSLKPFGYGIHRALKKLNLNADEVVMVGDQLLTDIWAANMAGTKSILVKPLLNSDAWNTKINRFFEYFIKKRLVKKYPGAAWQEEIK
ncbi:Hydrolase, HAD subfamily IIIA [Pediococcus damnosus]|uniref:Hydrolase, HAD subfamily IIIA n=1 Tax=Pediococcus damnosus TaxID=51663 RepID=A0AAC9FIF7_9LACO|nr:YqeG family HAD IIIA-type phosphatase [Pediococcus damnosus]AMV61357.1 Hydrolase, HAD subfamily IIIA [Pediococcus damnosus]AMV62287.1 Hydrolase, HAD subfamily IIIA [Pediococcus damnosus]AMV65716.1 Hydrolase, HAD subfamily IIIA [Pediococcus damnosus]AMV67854.1 Hydrolase, HAD subfamily IIIA [Pediococcus damnosus]AMV70058.1 Hydrolase, HAD subfamily IIIA [Pediococcus damnosus]